MILSESTFHWTSQTLGWLIDPISWVLILAVSTFGLSLTGRDRAVTYGVALIVLTIAVVFQSPLAGIVMRPLEQQYPFAPVLPEQVDGIVVLGGAENLGLSAAYGNPQLNEESERLTEFIALARAHPEARLAFSGGAGGPAVLSPADVARKFLRSQGFDPARVVFEAESRNTHESAQLTRRLVQPPDGANWVLITSASHMPRAHGAFAKAGWTVIPYPVSYRVSHVASPADRDYSVLKVAVREWIGIAAYTLTGRM